LRFDFRLGLPVNSLHWFFQLFQILSVRASLPFGEDREAGENPALPRNCERGNLQLVTGSDPGKAGCSDRMAGTFFLYPDILTRAARRPAHTVHRNSFA
jgi:hypothetical protein